MNKEAGAWPQTIHEAAETLLAGLNGQQRQTLAAYPEGGVRALVGGNLFGRMCHLLGVGRDGNLPLVLDAARRRGTVIVSFEGEEIPVIHIEEVLVMVAQTARHHLLMREQTPTTLPVTLEEGAAALLAHVPPESRRLLIDCADEHNPNESCRRFRKAALHWLGLECDGNPELLLEVSRECDAVFTTYYGDEIAMLSPEAVVGEILNAACRKLREPTPVTLVRLGEGRRCTAPIEVFGEG
ncbi:MAG: hypothetical protein COX57_10295 [Alphaproteobacteria bacterium CG_4_10_14_0_2_um_filter_63_37]|nr:MAG: hypothetical protein AUJ55_01380 [Proteobacteria bacterium CG1_02_64_396]PJA24097.1 MAG: hypothetical protein COX57_10295 [Alphaproteobacteria bacterium CG_4_10_14_0_2_um_filter_63_37]